MVGVGAAACVACCAGPVFGFVAAAGFASVVGAVVFGAVGLVVVLAVAAVVWRRRRHRSAQCAPAGRPVHVATPQLEHTSPVGES